MNVAEAIAARLSRYGLELARGPGDALYLLALTHPSYAAEHGGDDNQRLELLGDAVLGLAVAELLFDLHPGGDEGLLTRQRAALVQKRSFAARARSLGLGELVRLGHGEGTSGGRTRDSVLSDAFEALIGAVYRANGWDKVRQLVDRLFREEALTLPTNHTQAYDAKTALQIRAMAELHVAPAYRIVETRGPIHTPTFVAEVELAGTVRGRGEGPSKRLAEQAAAQLAMAALTPKTP